MTKEEVKKDLDGVSGSALSDLQLLRDAIQIAEYLAWDIQLDTVGGKKALDIINEIHNRKYGSGEGLWVQTRKALDAIEKHLMATNKQ